MNLERKLSSAKKSRRTEKINKVFEEIFNEYSKLCAFIIYKYIKDEEDVKDLVMDIFIKFFDVALKQDIDNIKGYLISSSKNSSINFLKRQETNIIYNDNILIDELLDDNNQNNDYEELIKEMKDILSEEEINIIILHTVYDYTFKEISKKYSKSESTIKTLYYRALKKYRKEKSKWKIF